ncbi:LysE family translocator [Cellvibrio japonicus]|uniref:Transporter, LysE family n=1 Tax=Cellvibrio japonicus (strain Ueda107) TaxID=498211 RepID=B3PBX8_CELJU|nr:LysE family translocator [Cellvibrio japonicus]ACE85186.1 transporter, LysE family [Cellvibrio japonicus Ueda107]QEI11793.1 LysE family translocator [Cellvibrio japonicus]QEI15367.1 LysE family translocator [Cellvibrio japonicus]QEI18946.1 LysE family translocator [Cellvibrio japonicus]
MLETASLLMLVSYATVMSITPGPNNLLLMSSGLLFGLRRTGWHMAGITLGVVALIGSVGAGLGVLFAWEPRLQWVLKILGSLYMLWLAARLWHTDNLGEVAAVSPVRFWEAWGFQFINPKAWLMATTVVAVFVPDGQGYWWRLLQVSAIFGVVGAPCIFVWAASGAGLRAWLGSPCVLLWVNRVMAALAAMTAGLFWG